MELYLWPILYTDKEGGEFKDWPGDAVTLDLLSVLKEEYVLPEYPCVEIGGVEVHSLIFRNPLGFPDARWDCINGWTTNLYDAQLRRANA